MKRQKYFKLAALFTVLMSVAGLWWACNFESVGPKDPSAIKLADILAELENSRSQTQAEMAIQHLLEKTGVGIEVRGSQYGGHRLPDGFVLRLAQEHLLYLQDGTYDWTWGQMFEATKLLSEGDWNHPVEFAEAMARLQEQAAAAQNDPEKPNNALLLAMVTKSANTSPAVLDETAIVTPVQEFLFGVWANYEFGDAAAPAKSKYPGKLKFTFTSVTCKSGDKVDKKYTTTQEVTYNSKKQKECLEDAKEDYKQDVKKALKEKKCSKVQHELQEAYEEVLEEIEECHDQGSGH
jgi:hypothetical protein